MYSCLALFGAAVKLTVSILLGSGSMGSVPVQYLHFMGSIVAYTIQVA